MNLLPCHFYHWPHIDWWSCAKLDQKVFFAKIPNATQETFKFENQLIVKLTTALPNNLVKDAFSLVKWQQ